MADLEKALEKEVSRRSFLKTTGIGLGVAAGALVFGTGMVGAQAQTGTVAEAPLPYVELDPEEARLRGHAGYYQAGCSFGAFYAIASMLRDKVGGPYNQIPLRMLGYGRGGFANWGTICGALNGASAAINLVCPDADTNKLVAELLGWYTRFPFPSAEATAIGVAGGFKYTTKQYPKIELVTSVSDSPLCHASNAKWIAKSGFLLPSPERKERCARLTGDVAAKAVELLNAWKAGKFVATFKVDDQTAGCLSCHAEDQEGKMACVSCHEPH
ncbi:MAG: C-GCAxxG-C-C family protein [Rectinemataceae bacterium]|nr:C-GCAxxG-C-C family protein [Spirochaetaceae bacterium]